MPDTFSSAPRGCSSVRRTGFLISISLIMDQPVRTQSAATSVRQPISLKWVASCLSRHSRCSYAFQWQCTRSLPCRAQGNASNLLPVPLRPQ